MATMATNVNISWNFAIPVFSKQAENFGALKQRLLELIYEKRDAAIASNAVMPIHATWQSNYDMHLWKEPVIADLLELIGQFSTECISSVSNFHTLKGNVIITGCRASVRGYTAWSAPHQHLGEHWAGVLYLDVEKCLNDEDQSRTGGVIELLNPNRMARMSGFQNSVMHAPKDGLMVLFPGYLEHMIHPNLSRNDRVAINFFINVH